MKARARSIAISSGKGGTGKTTLTANLGVVLANGGDPLIRMNGAPTPARTLIDSLKNLSSWKKEWGIPSEVLGAMGANLNPATVQRASDASEYIKEKASEEISEGMDLDQEKAEDIVNELTKRKAHGEEVTIEEAKKLGIKVKDLRLDKYKEVWNKIWEHYLRTTSYIREEFKPPRAKVMGTKKGTQFQNEDCEHFREGNNHTGNGAIKEKSEILENLDEVTEKIVATTEEILEGNGYSTSVQGLESHEGMSD